MNQDIFLRQIIAEQTRFFPGARLAIMERLPFYLKVRIGISKNQFIEIRANSRNRRQSFVLVDDGKRIAGFDNLNGWHAHPFENPSAHHKISPPSLLKIFRYFRENI